VKGGLIAVAIGTLALAGHADAAPRQSGPLMVRDAPSAPQPKLNFRLVRDADLAPDPVRHSGMIATTDIAPNVTLGFGILKAAPKRPGPGEWRLDPGAPRSRKAAVSFDFRF
jgi:hypothetical protein